MHALHAAALCLLASVAHGQPAAKAVPLTDADRAAVLKTLALKGNPRGQVMNECGDGPDLHLLVRSGAGWREIYAARGRMLIILPGATGGVRDIADGGPGMSFPVWTRNGTRYAVSRRQIANAELEKIDAKYLP
jgi:hypothetical protein